MAFEILISLAYFPTQIFLLTSPYADIVFSFHSLNLALT